MRYGFDTDRDDAAVAAFLVYTVWKSRDPGRLKVDMEIWARVERFTKAAAKRAQTLPEFLGRLMPRLGCEAIRPIRMADEEGTLRRDFLTGVLARPAADPVLVLRTLVRETSLAVLLVRERLEREKESRAAQPRDDEDEGEDQELAA